MRNLSFWEVVQFLGNFWKVFWLIKKFWEIFEKWESSEKILRNFQKFHITNQYRELSLYTLLQIYFCQPESVVWLVKLYPHSNHHLIIVQEGQIKVRGLGEGSGGSWSLQFFLYASMMLIATKISFSNVLLTTLYNSDFVVVVANPCND